MADSAREQRFWDLTIGGVVFKGVADSAYRKITQHIEKHPRDLLRFTFEGDPGLYEVVWTPGVEIVAELVEGGMPKEWLDLREFDAPVWTGE